LPFRFFSTLLFLCRSALTFPFLLKFLLFGRFFCVETLQRCIHLHAQET